MSRKIVSNILIVLGLITIIVSLAADSLGLGNQPVFGWKQILGTGLGIVLALAGIWMRWRKTGQLRSPDSDRGFPLLANGQYDLQSCNQTEPTQIPAEKVEHEGLLLNVKVRCKGYAIT